MATHARLFKREEKNELVHKWANKRSEMLKGGAGFARRARNTRVAVSIGGRKLQHSQPTHLHCYTSVNDFL